MKQLICLIFILAGGIQALATESMDLDVRLLHRKSKRPYTGVTLLATGVGNSMTDVTDRKGICHLYYDFSLTGLSLVCIYAIPKRGDTILLKRFYKEPKSFKEVESQHYRTTLYLR